MNQDSQNNPAGKQFIDNIFSNPAFTQMGFTYAETLYGNAKQTTEGNFTQYMSELKYYFNVNSSYVRNKLRVLLFPLGHQWKRRVVKNENGVVVCMPPKDDINAPDLYIPSMAFVTYVLMYGFIMGTCYEKFTPELLATVSSKAIAFMLLEVILLKLGFYLLGNSAKIPVADLVAYCVYIFVGIVINMIVGLTFGSKIYYLCLLVTSSFMTIFMVSTLFLQLVVPDGSDQFSPVSSSNSRNYFLFLIAILQPLISYLLGVV